MRGILAILFTTCVAAQGPVIGDVNLYGFYSVSPASVLDATGVRPGLPLPKSKGELESRIRRSPGIADARVESLCCDGASAVLFIGIQEKDMPDVVFLPTPAGNATLSPPIWNAYRRSDRKQLAEYAAGRIDELRNVLRNAGEPETRAAAAAVIGAAPDKREAIPDLEYALADPSEMVRASALKQLIPLARQPELQGWIGTGSLMPLLRSVTLNDRLLTLRVLVSLTESPNPEALRVLRTRAMPFLAEMARWKPDKYGYPAFLLLGRAAHMTDAEVRAAWDKSDREAEIRRMMSGG